jgi:hypothetical protein
MDSGGAIAAAAVGKPVSILHSSKSKQKLPNKLTKGDKAASGMAMTTPNRLTSKSAHPQGSSPIAQNSKVDLNLDLPNLDLNLNHNKDDHVFDAKEDADSISKMIASTRKELFKAGGEAAQGNQGGGKAEKANMQGKQNAWKPITKQATVVVKEVGGGKTGTFFSKGTVFNEKFPPDKDGAEKKTTKNHKCGIRLWFKVLHGSADVQ